MPESIIIIDYGTLPLHEGFLFSSCEMVWLRGGGETIVRLDDDG